MTSSRSKVHPKHKRVYRVENWSVYDRALVGRGGLTVWFTPEAIGAWTPPQSGKRGGQPRYSDLAIETALTLRLVYGLPWRQTEGFLRSLVHLMGLDLHVPDHTTLSRRSRSASIRLQRPSGAGPVHAPVCRITADGAYDRRHVYVAAQERGADTVIPTRRDAVRSGDPVLADRDAHLVHIESVGRRRWRVEVRQHLQARVENTFYRYKRAFGADLRA